MKQIDRWKKEIGKEEMDSTGLDQLYSGLSGFVPYAKKTLAVGCGNGSEMQYLHGEVRGIDINPKNKRPDIDIGDMHDMPYEDGEFDVVYSRDSFEHAVAPIAALSEMARVSSRYVIIVLPDDIWTESPLHLVIPNMRQMMNLAEKAGLMLVKHDSLRHTMPHGYVLEQYLYKFVKRSLLEFLP